MTIVAGLVMLGILVVVHEFGHFIVAKLFGVAVPVFSIGMGPRLFGFSWRGTDVRVSLLPVGGYVKLAGADPFGEEDAESEVDPAGDFMGKPVWQRFLVMLAGPAFNLLLPFVLFTAVLLFGEPQASSQIGLVIPGSVAETQGLEPGDSIRSVDGDAVSTWGEVLDHLDAARQRTVQLEVENGGAVRSVALDLAAVPTDRLGTLDDGILGISPSWLSTRIGIDDPTSPAAVAGLVTGDWIRSVDGQPVDRWVDLQDRLNSPGPHTVTAIRIVDGEPTDVTATLRPGVGWQARPDDALSDPRGLLPVSVFIGDISKGSPAEAAGLQPSDRLLSVDGVPVRSWVDLTRLVEASTQGLAEGAEPRPLTVVLRRKGAEVTVALTPRLEVEAVRGAVFKRPIMGVARYPDAFIPGDSVRVYYSLVDAVPRAVTDTGALVVGTMKMLVNVITMQVPVQDSIGGPVAIFHMAGAGAERGIFAFVRMIGGISISLAIFNLLPVPVLDGGQIALYAIEVIRGRPVSLAVRERLQMAGVLALVALMLVVFVFDVHRAFESWSAPR